MFKNRRFKNCYGVDQLSLFIGVLALPWLTHNIVWPIGVILLLIAVFRSLSTNKIKRGIELQKFNAWLQKTALSLHKILNPLIGKIQIRRQRYQQRKIYLFVKCPECKKQLRLPKNKGKVSVTCPVCHHKFLKKT